MANGHLDEIDIKILRHIQDNARIGIMELVHLVNLSKNPVGKRIRKLKNLGYIKSYIGLLDREKIGQPVLVITHVKVHKQTTEQLEAFENMCKNVPEIQFCLHVSGSWNFILHITAKTPQDYYDFLMEKITSLDYVAHVESCFVMKECKSYGAFAL